MNNFLQGLTVLNSDIKWCLLQFLAPLQLNFKILSCCELGPRDLTLLTLASELFDSTHRGGLVGGVQSGEAGVFVSTSARTGALFAMCTPK
jgi:hypothetical protein